MESSQGPDLLFINQIHAAANSLLILSIWQLIISEMIKDHGKVNASVNLSIIDWIIAVLRETAHSLQLCTLDLCCKPGILSNMCSFSDLWLIYTMNNCALTAWCRNTLTTLGRNALGAICASKQWALQETMLSALSTAMNCEPCVYRRSRKQW